MTAPRILQLATRIAANTTAISDYLAANNLPEPSFAVDASQDPLIPQDAPEMEKLRRAVIADTEELHQLMLGPREYLLRAGSLVCSFGALVWNIQVSLLFFIRSSYTMSLALIGDFYYSASFTLRLSFFLFPLVSILPPPSPKQSPSSYAMIDQRQANQAHLPPNSKMSCSLTKQSPASTSHAISP